MYNFVFPPQRHAHSQALLCALCMQPIRDWDNTTECRSDADNIFTLLYAIKSSSLFKNATYTIDM